MTCNTHQKISRHYSSLQFLNEGTNNLSIFLNVGSIRQSKLLFFDSVVTSDLYLFQEIVPLIPCFIFSKNLILSFIDQVTTETWSLVLIMIKCTPLILLCSLKAQSFVHNRSSYILQFINGKSRNLKKSLRYLGEIMTSTFEIWYCWSICISFI